MTGKIIHMPMDPHICDGKPHATDYPNGTIWQCDDCTAQWIVLRGQWAMWRDSNDQPVVGPNGLNG